MTKVDREQAIDNQVDIDQIKNIHQKYKSIVTDLDEVFESDEQEELGLKVAIFNVFVKAGIFSESDLEYAT